ncbi:DNA-directed DNA polymerase II small subunit [Candidatus Woesearchaeota archaeon]|nr:DNA-directed DNA polymerase II small subunit [Candidatus Woesearchaeota archaeon]
MEKEKKKQILKFFMQKGELLSPEYFNNLDDKDKTPEQIYEEYISKKQEKETQIYTKNSSVNITSTYKEDYKKRDITDFVAYFNARYKSIENILMNRQELANIISISRIKDKPEKDSVAFIGIVKEKQQTANNNTILELEDPTGTVKVLINKNKPDMFDSAKDIVLDETIGIVGVTGNNIVFANNILWPDVPIQSELKKSPDESYAIFLSDVHIGSNNFLEKKFNNFIHWLNKEIGDENQKKIVNNISYIFIVGDLIDGLGIYPGQEDELVIKEIKQQYSEAARLLKKLPSHINIIICPGNHDALRIAEPQPEFYKDFAEDLWNLPNVSIVSNPSTVNIHSSEGFPGFDVLLYHGYSFDHYVSNVESIRNNGGYDRADLIMKFLLQRRHLAPTHTSTLYIPDSTRDPLVIDKIPDFFATGHIHKCSVADYRNITMICGSCWQAKTPFQEKVGHHPEPARVPIVNLQTREIKIMKF